MRPCRFLIEVCATGGRTLASKLGIDQDRIAYTPLGDLKTATEKVRRDAPAIAVCDLSWVASMDSFRIRFAASRGGGARV